MVSTAREDRTGGSGEWEWFTHSELCGVGRGLSSANDPQGRAWGRDSLSTYPGTVHLPLLIMVSTALVISGRARETSSS